MPVWRIHSAPPSLTTCRFTANPATPAEAYNIGSTQAKELTALGFNVNFSPVADVLTNEDNTVVKERSFGSDPDLVSGMVTQVVKGLTDGGMLCAPKHFPGHGSTGGRHPRWLCLL